MHDTTKLYGELGAAHASSEEAFRLIVAGKNALKECQITHVLATAEQRQANAAIHDLLVRLAGVIDSIPSITEALWSQYRAVQSTQHGHPTGKPVGDECAAS